MPRSAIPAPAAVRISVGMVSNFEDLYRSSKFAESLLNMRAEEL